MNKYITVLEYCTFVKYCIKLKVDILRSNIPIVLCDSKHLSTYLDFFPENRTEQL